MDAWLLKEPWGLLTGEKTTLNDGIFPESPMQLLLAADSKGVEYGNRKYKLSPLSPRFKWNDCRLVHYVLPNIWRPGSHRKNRLEQILRLRWRGQSGNQNVDLIPRLAPHQNDKEDTAILAEQTIEWQLSYFHELFNPDFHQSISDTLFAGGARVSWHTAAHLWRSDFETQTNARTSLIAKISENQRLLQTFKDIGDSPNQTLKKNRCKQHISNVQQLDSACIRWLAQRNGKTPLEKSMPTQRILAVTTNENFDTLENRIFGWVVKRLHKYARDYIQIRRSVEQSSKKKNVESLQKLLDEIARQDWLRSIPAPCSAIIPNYTLLHCPKYRRIWNLYKKLQKIERESEDAWEYQRLLWIDTGRKIVGSALEALSRKNLLLKPLCTSSVYLYDELQNGKWVRPPYTPGPYELNGSLLQHIDSMDVEDDSTLAQLIGPLGAHQVMKYAGNQYIVLWYLWNPYRDELINSCALAISKMKQLFLEEVDVKGLIITGPNQHDQPRVISSSCGQVKQAELSFSGKKNYDCISNILVEHFDSWVK